MERLDKNCNITKKKRTVCKFWRQKLPNIAQNQRNWYHLGIVEKQTKKSRKTISSILI